ncbi:hypothetical protein D3C74_257020 [compost metagenome]
MPLTVKGITYIKPVACCGFCGTPVFVLHDGVLPNERINESILKSKGIPPQTNPEPNHEPRCETCGKLWSALNFTLKEGEHLGENRSRAKMRIKPF